MGQIKFNILKYIQTHLQIEEKICPQDYRGQIKGKTIYGSFFHLEITLQMTPIKKTTLRAKVPRIKKTKPQANKVPIVIPLCNAHLNVNNNIIILHFVQKINKICLLNFRRQIKVVSY